MAMEATESFHPLKTEVVLQALIYLPYSVETISCKKLEKLCKSLERKTQQSTKDSENFVCVFGGFKKTREIWNWQFLARTTGEIVIKSQNPNFRH